MVLMAVPVAREILHHAFANAGVSALLLVIGGVAFSTAFILCFGGLSCFVGWSRHCGVARAFRAAPPVHHETVELESRTFAVVIRRALIIVAVLLVTVPLNRIGLYGIAFGFSALLGCTTWLILIRHQERVSAVLVKRAARRGLLFDRRINYAMARQISEAA
jgi:hypothetical protein